ncbi:MAG: hypothetical protein AAB533_02320 [Patescibacteria group bacterium]
MLVLRVGIPTNEKVYAATERLMIDAGYEIPRSPKRFFTNQDFAYQTGVQFVFARVSELARLVAIGKLDSAFVTKDWWEDCKDGFFCWKYFGKSSAKIYAEFPAYCQCEVSFVSKAHWLASGIAQGGIVSALVAFTGIMKRKPLIVTRFPRLVDKFFTTKSLISLLHEEFRGEKWVEGLHPEVALVNGSEELYTLLEVADFAVVQIETGETIANHSLNMIERILPSHLILVGNDHPDLPIFALNVLSAYMNLR